MSLPTYTRSVLLAACASLPLSSAQAALVHEFTFEETIGTAVVDSISGLTLNLNANAIQVSPGFLGSQAFSTVGTGADKAFIFNAEGVSMATANAPELP